MIRGSIFDRIFKINLFFLFIIIKLNVFRGSMSVDKVFRVFKILRFHRINSPDKNMRKGKREILEWKFRKSVPKFTQESTGL